MSLIDHSACNVSKGVAFWKKVLLGFLLVPVILTAGCIQYSFTGASIPPDVNSIYIPFFANQADSGISNLSDRLNDVLVNRFVNQSKLRLTNNRENADAVLEGVIVSYSNRAFSVSGQEQTDENQVSISVSASFRFTDKDEDEWDTRFSGTGNYDPNENPIQGEEEAAVTALERIANNMFNDAVSDW